MFNFIFDGKIGEMLAPVVPSNQLFIAIQHHKNDDIPSLMLSMDSNTSQKLSEGGYSAIHVACRYNNRFALELLLSKGVEIDVPDNQGNTPLHFAAKYGHVDLCKVLIDRGGSLGRRNKQNQNAYDVAENHVVRQYLLPLVFQAERGQSEFQHHPVYQQQQQQQPVYQQQVQQQHSNGFPNNHSPPPPSQPSASNYSRPSVSHVFSSNTSESLPTSSSSHQQGGFAPPPTHPGSSNGPEGIVPPVYKRQQLPVYSGATPAQRASPNIRTFQPDGFHSSASDPELQRKYGHTSIVNNIAPPPTDMAFLPPGGSMTGNPQPAQLYGPPPSSLQSQQQQGGTVYSRYVPYDPHTNSAAPAPVVYQPPPAAAAAAAPVTVGVFNNSAQPISIMSSGGSGRLLGNKVLPQDANAPSSINQSAVPVVSTPPFINVFNPSTDCDVIDMNSTSSSVM